MKLYSAVRRASNTLYAAGTAIALALCAVALFGPDAVVNPDAMLCITWREQAFFFLALGSAPMLIACGMFYRINIKAKNLKNILLVFIPGIICAACALYIAGVIAAGFVLNG